MLKKIFSLTIKELKVLLHDRGAFTGLFILPIAFILVMTTALQGAFNMGGSDNPIQLLVVNQDQGAIAGKVIADLGDMSGLELVEKVDDQLITRARAEELITSRQYSLGVVFPSNFSDAILAAASNPAGVKAMVSFIADPAVGSQFLLPARGMVQGYIERQAYLSQAPLQTMQGFDHMALAAPAAQSKLVRDLGVQFIGTMTDSSSSSERNLGVDTQVVAPANYQAARYPTSAEQNVPGYTLYGVFFIITTVSTSLFREKNEGTFRRLQAAPVSRTILLAGKLLPYYIVNLIQIALMLGFGVLVFHISLGTYPLTLIPVAMVTALVSTGLGLMITTLGKTQEQAGSLSSILSIVLSALGGMMVPVYVMPSFMQSLSKAIPQSWALSALQDVIVRGQGLEAVLPALAVLLGFALVFWTVGLRRFRFSD
jgi:ABC-2 type transport system permease protein